MSQKLISRSPDLLLLREDGYDIEIRGSYLVMNDVPYINAQREVKRGQIVSSLNLAGDITTRPDNHQVHFAGDMPCHADGSPMQEIISSSGATRLDEGLVIDHSFSQKPACGYYENYHAKMTTYAAMLVGHARTVDPSATAQTYRVEQPEEEDNSPFQYLDTASSRADINMVSRKIALRRVAILGLGGSGAYILDFVSKTPVLEIHTFDGDKFSTHNAFRSPGAASIEELRLQPPKTEYFKGRYTNMHKGIKAHDVYVDASNVNLLLNMDFVFVCIDKPEAKAPIVAKLIEWGLPFVDVGMGVYLKSGTLGGIVRVTGCTSAKTDHVARRISMGDDAPAPEYDSNIQIAELNALNAAMAVIWWKKHFGFYADFEDEHFTGYAIESNLLVSEDCL